MKKTVLILGILALTLCLSATAETSIPGRPFQNLQTAILEEIPEDRSTRVYPLSDRRAILVDNENVKEILITADDLSAPFLCYVVPEETAHLRFELDPADNPEMILFADAWGPAQRLSDLLDPERNVYRYDQPTEATVDGDLCHWNAVVLADRELSEETLYFVIRDEAYIGECVDQLTAAGYQNVRWEYAEPVEGESEPAEAYVVRVVDQNNEPVPGLYVNFCTDEACMMARGDGDGVITFSGAPDVYHLQLLRVPEGYSADPGFEFYTEPAYGNWILRIWKN